MSLADNYPCVPSVWVPAPDTEGTTGCSPMVAPAIPVFFDHRHLLLPDRSILLFVMTLTQRFASIIIEPDFLTYVWQSPITPMERS